VFEKTLKDKLKRIFDMEKVTLDEPGDSQEQDCLFVEVLSSKNSVRDGKFIAKVSGTITVNANSDRLPFGYFSKKIAEANQDDVGPFFFYDIETSAGRFGNIDQRKMSFVFLFDAQYDPNVGTLNEVQFEVGT
jgi:hypothetical protein